MKGNQQFSKLERIRKHVKWLPVFQRSVTYTIHTYQTIFFLFLLHFIITFLIYLQFLTISTILELSPKWPQRSHRQRESAMESGAWAKVSNAVFTNTHSGRKKCCICFYFTDQNKILQIILPIRSRFCKDWPF